LTRSKSRKTLTLDDVDTLVLLSGGIDSSVLLQATKKQVEARVAALFLNFGQDPASRQQAYAERLCIKLNVPLHVIDAPNVVKLYAAATDPPHVMQTESDSGPKAFGPPVHIMDSEGASTFAAFTAQWLGFERSLHGLTVSDERRWPDLSVKKMANAMNSLLSVCGCKTRYCVPFIDAGFTNEDVVSYGRGEGFDIESTWSCLWGLRYHCGKCAGCKKRRDSLGNKSITQYIGAWPDTATPSIRR
jgi:7-cyano-7-deazaguanine synthase